MKWKWKWISGLIPIKLVFVGSSLIYLKRKKVYVQQTQKCRPKRTPSSYATDQSTRRRKPPICHRSQTHSTKLQLYGNSFIGGGNQGTRRRKPSTCRRSQTRSTTLQLYCDSFIGGGNQSTSSACIWSIYLSVDLILQRLWFLFRNSLIEGCC